MIFFYHLLTFIAGALGLTLAFFLLKFQILRNNIFIIFFFFLGLGLFIHAIILDGIIDSKESYVKYYVNLEPWPENLTFNFLWNQIFEIKQK
jgi:hypothetical protein